MKKTLAVVAFGLMAGTGAYADKIERACNASERKAAPRLCQCIQKVADEKLSRTDQIIAAKFFADPELAQDTRRSKDQGKARFWQRYKNFGAAARRACG